MENENVNFQTYENGMTPRPPYMQNMPVKEKKRFKLSTGDMLFALVLFGLCAALVVFGFCSGLVIGFTLSFDALFIAVSVYLTKKNSFPGVFACVCAALALASSAVFTVTMDYCIRILLLPCMFVLSVIWFSSVSGKKLPSGELPFIGGLLRHSVADTFDNLAPSVASLATGKNGKNKTFVKVLAGVLAAVPVLCVIVPELVRADAAFEGLVDSLVENIAGYVLRLVAVIIITPLGISFCYSLKKDDTVRERKKGFHGIDGVYTLSFMCVISVCYLVYLFSQLAYFFSAFAGILPEDYTFSYAEYARRGFFELCVIAAINFVIVYFIGLFTAKKENGKLPLSVRILSAFISLFTLIIAAAGISKMVLYIREYGMTLSRIFAGVFMIFICVVFAAVIAGLFVKNAKIIQTVIISASALLLVLGLCNVDRIVCSYNVNAYKNGILKTVDIYYLENECGPEAIPYLDMLTADRDEVIASAALDLLFEEGSYYYECEYTEEEIFNEGDEYPCYDYFRTVDSSKVTDSGIFRYNAARQKAVDVLNGYFGGKVWIGEREDNPDFGK